MYRNANTVDFRRSKYVFRVGSDQIPLVNGPGNQEKDNFDNILLSSNTL